MSKSYAYRYPFKYRLARMTGAVLSITLMAVFAPLLFVVVSIKAVLQMVVTGAWLAYQIVFDNWYDWD